MELKKFIIMISFMLLYIGLGNYIYARMNKKLEKLKTNSFSEKERKTITKQIKKEFKIKNRIYFVVSLILLYYILKYINK